MYEYQMVDHLKKWVMKISIATYQNYNPYVQLMVIVPKKIDQFMKQLNRRYKILPFYQRQFKSLSHKCSSYYLLFINRNKKKK